MNILVTGAKGQLGQCIQSEIEKYGIRNNYFFEGSDTVNILSVSDIRNYVIKNSIDIIINCAAYTAVDKAEGDDNSNVEPITAYNINVIGVDNLVEVCKDYNIYLIHISTDFVFDGRSNSPYNEYDECNPLCVYGSTKRSGERIVLGYDKGIVVRTSWLYSEFGKNFYKTMKSRILEEKPTIVVSDQIGTPTYARDLAKFLIFIINTDKIKDCKGVYHFSNSGCCSWYDFAAAIEIMFSQYCSDKYITPCKTEEYPCKAVRPKYSVLGKDRLKEINFTPRHWMTALKDCMLEEYDLTINNKK